jgi:NB-ARC domain/Tetratricopeptide repeat
MSGLSEYGEDRSLSGDTSNVMQVKGDKNQVIGQNYGIAIHTVKGNVFLKQPQPKFLSLHQLPSDIADFTGRAIEIDVICQQLLGGKSLVISAVAGMAGVGKSALAIHVAQQLAESDFPDVQLYVDLRGADGDGLEPGEILAQWLRAFDPDTSIPSDFQERVRAYRSQLAGKRAIVLLDNAKDEDQVRYLLPGNTCAAIVTSRRILGALEGATVLNLKVLTESEAENLLARLVGMERLQAEPEAATEILQLCGGLPLATRIVGGTLKSKLHWRLKDYSRKLADEKKRLAHLQLSDLAIRASFEVSYQELSIEDGLLFGRLGLLVGKDFGEELAAVLQDSNIPVIDSIERLIDAQLLEANIDSRYRFHDLLRLFAWNKLTESISLEQQGVIKQQIINWGEEKYRMMNVYLDPVQRRQIVQEWVGSGEVDTGFDEQDLTLSALSWFEQEREQLLIGINWATEAEHWDTTVSFVANLISFFQLRSYWQNWEQTCLIAVIAAQKTGDRVGEGNSLNYLASVYRLQSRSDEAIDCFQQSLTIFRELGDRRGEGKSLNNLGTMYQSQNG